MWLYIESQSRYLTTPCDAKTLPFTWLRCLLDDGALAECEGAWGGGGGDDEGVLEEVVGGKLTLLVETPSKEL